MTQATRYKNSATRQLYEALVARDLSGEHRLEQCHAACKNGANANAICEGGTSVTLLMVAVEKGWLDIVTLLVQNGANVNKKGMSNTPLGTAVSEGHLEVAKLLLDVGAEPNYVIPNQGATALIPAALSGRDDLCRLLVENGAGIEFQWAYTGQTPAELAREKGYDKTANVIETTKPKKSARNYDDITIQELVSWRGEDW